MIELSTSPPLPLALLAAGIIALVAWRARSLTPSGAVAALVVGTIALCAAWGVGLLLIAWFALAALLSRLGKARKAARVAAVVAKPDARDWMQVLANGGTFAACAAATFAIDGAASPRQSLLLHVAAAGALAAAGADTWATEIGTLYGAAPWSLRTRSRVPVGTSGAVTLEGTLALVAGATVIALLAGAFGALPYSSHAIVAVTGGGVAGAASDTVIGAWAQQRRWCSRCMLETEQRVHGCGTPTVVVAGARVLDNDAVNLACTVIGAVVAAVIV